MSYLWEVEHRFEQGLPVANKVYSYQSLNITLEYTDDYLTVINHTLETEDSEDRDIIELSKNKLKYFLDYLQFGYGLLLPPYKSRIKEKPENLPYTLEKSTSISLDCYICGTPRLPNNTFFSKMDYRRLLILANDAKDMSPEYAIRNYYIILEEFHPDDYDKNNDRIEIKHIRDFVSHSKINNSRILGFLSEKLEEEIQDFIQYDPLNPKHKKLVSKYSSIGRKLVKEEFIKLINNQGN